MYFYPSAFQRIESGLNAPFWSADNYKNLPWLSQGIFWGKKYFTVFLFSPFVLFPVLDDEFSPSHVAEPKVGFVAVSSLGIQHCPERLSPSERSAKKKQAKFEQPCHSWEQNLHKSSWNETTSRTWSWILHRQFRTEETPNLTNRQ